MRTTLAARVLAPAVIGVLGPAAAALAQTTTISGANLALKSAGSNILGQNGYVGTYITLSQPGPVTLSVTASGAAGGGATPHMNIVVDDSSAGFDVGTSTGTYSTTVNLPAGTHFVRTELNNYAGRSLTIGGLTVGGASVSNTSTDANALAAANTYIDNFRKGPATVALAGPGGVPLLPGTPVPVALERHAFNFGGTVSGFNSNPDLAANPAPGSTAAKFQQFLTTHFNTIVPSNGGKWAYNEATQNVVTMSFIDQMAGFAQAHGLRMRMHNLLWGVNNTQQPSWVLNGSTGLLDKAAAGDATAKAQLRTAISKRIQYYVGTTGNRATRYIELDGLNESLHQPKYWNMFGAAGMADIYNEIASAAAQAGNPGMGVYLNEYNVLQFSPASISSTGVQSGSDPYANWYRSHVDQIRSAGGTVSGIGVQYYADARSTLGGNVHSAAMIQKALQNLSVEGVPISLTEFGLASGTSQADGARIMDDTMRMVFGTPGATTFMIWGWFADPGQATPVAALVDSNTWTLTPMGQKWESLMSGWSTNVTPTVGADGKITFSGFYGDFRIGNQSGAMTLKKGTTQYSIGLTAAPAWSSWNPASSGDWTASANWNSGGIANADGQTAYFGPAGGARTVSVDAPVIVGMIALDSSNGGYTIGGGGTITLRGFDDDPAGHAAAVYVAAGSHTISAPLALADNTRFTVPAGATLTVSNLLPTAAALTKSGPGVLAVNQLRTGGLSIEEGTLSVLAGRTSNAASVITGALNITAGGAALDLNDQDLILDYTGPSPLEAVRGLIEQGYAGGNWNGGGGGGGGIVSGSAAAGAGSPHRTALGIGEAGALGLSTFDGQPVDSTAVLIRYTVAGDANLDGAVDTLDFNTLASRFGSAAGASWTSGDFNYDGAVDTLDFNVLASNFGQVLPANRAAALVPEPAAAAMPVLIGTLLARHRRRRRRR